MFPQFVDEFVGDVEGGGAGPFGVACLFGPVFFGVESDGGGFDPHGEVFGDDSDVVVFGGEVRGDGEDSRVVVVETESCGQDVLVDVVEFDVECAPRAVDG